MFAKHYPDYPIAIEQVQGGGLVTAIEEGDAAMIEELTTTYAAQFSDACEAIILGCTHYPLILSSLQKKLPTDCRIVNPGVVAAKKLVGYLQQHASLAQQCTTCTGGGAVHILTTQLTDHFVDQCQALWGQGVRIETTTI